MMALEGIRIIDLSRLLPGPYCTLLLADLGAEVYKIEQPETGDYARTMRPGLFYMANRNKKSVTLDLRKESAKRVFYRLVEHCDVVVEGFRPGGAEKLGVGYEQLQRINPKIIYSSISSYGQTGPYRLLPGHDVNFQALTGAMSIKSQVDFPPVRSGIAVADLSSGILAAFSILSALLARERTGEGQYLDVSMADCLFSWVSFRAWDYIFHDRDMATSHVGPANDIFTTADGRQISLGVGAEEHFWKELCKTMEKEELLGDPRYLSDALRRENSQSLHGILKEIFKGKTFEEWSKLLTGKGIPWAPVKSLREAFEDRHFREREMISEIFVKDLGRNIKQVPFPVKMSKTPAKLKTSPPSIGENTLEILTWLGYSKDDISALKREKAI